MTSQLTLAWPSRSGVFSRAAAEGLGYAHGAPGPLAYGYLGTDGEVVMVSAFETRDLPKYLDVEPARGPCRLPLRSLGLYLVDGCTPYQVAL